MRCTLYLLLLLTSTGCTEGWVTVVIQPDDRSRLDVLELTVRAMAADAEQDPGLVCRPTERVFARTESGFSWPLELVFVASDDRWRCLALQVSGTQRGQDPFFAEQLICDVDYERKEPYNFYLYTAYTGGTSRCPEGQVLLDGTCQESLVARGFFGIDAELAEEPCGD